MPEPMFRMDVLLGHVSFYEMPPRLEDGWTVGQARVVEYDHHGNVISSKIVDGARYRFE